MLRYGLTRQGAHPSTWNRSRAVRRLRNVTAAGLGVSAIALGVSHTVKSARSPEAGANILEVQLPSALQRALTTVSATVQVSLEYRKLERAEDATPEQRRELDLWAAQKVLDLCKRHGGVYIKAAQFAASTGMLPPEYHTALVVLQDRAPPSPVSEVRQTLEEELGTAYEDVLLNLSEAPIAAASLAQVHTATLRNGERVAVKVQYRSTREHLEADLFTLRTVSKFVSWAFPDYSLHWLVPQFERRLRAETNFRTEALNGKRIASALASNSQIKVPKVYEELSSRRVLTMEFEEGFRITDKEKMHAEKLDPREVAGLLSEALAQLTFQHGFFHADPHPGNILVRALPGKRALSGFYASFNIFGHGQSSKERTMVPQLILLDHGACCELSESTRLAYCKLWDGLSRLDNAQLEEACNDLGERKLSAFYPLLFAGDKAASRLAWHSVPREQLLRIVREIKERREQGTITADFTNFFSGLPPALTELMKVSALVKGTMRDLYGPSCRNEADRKRLKVFMKHAAIGLHGNAGQENDASLLQRVSRGLRLGVWVPLTQLRTYWDLSHIAKPFDMPKV
mmetsp:Transcript_7966/g.29467  ORF Transcript_7966/g.29467 Transcript_7966/m.29467 type:complete len:572 (-) Transcript_7966:93-1808(-)